MALLTQGSSGWVTGPPTRGRPRVGVRGHENWVCTLMGDVSLRA